jgi:hypothetical protein
MRRAERLFQITQILRIKRFKLTGKQINSTNGQSLNDYLTIQKATYQQDDGWDENMNYGF